MNFNHEDTSIHLPSYTVAGGGSARHDYFCAYTDFAAGSTVNLQSGDVDGKSLRVRNPSESIIFRMPTTGYEDVVFAYAIHRTNNGADTNEVSYTIDGTNYLPASTANSANANWYVVGTEFGLRTYTFEGYLPAKNNPNFAVKIKFTTKNTGDEGNNRIDNVTLKGKPIGSTGMADISGGKKGSTVYPNPATDKMTIGWQESGISTIALYDVTGTCRYRTEYDGELLSIDIRDLARGMYLLMETDSKGTTNRTLVQFN